MDPQLTDIVLFGSLRSKLSQLRGELLEAEGKSAAELSTIHPRYRASALNLIQYLVARQVDLRPVQLELSRHGLSSLGRMEGHVRDALDQVIARLADALSSKSDHPASDSEPQAQALTAGEGDRLLRVHTQDLFGPMPPGRHVYVMVTAPDASEVDAAWAGRLLDAGMNVLRVNGAHEGVPQWQHIVQTARAAAATRNVSLKVLVDLPGPKLRTIAPWPGPEVTRWKPERDAFGRVTTPCSVVLRSAPADGVLAEGPELPVPAALWSELAVGDELLLSDARGRKRRLAVVDRTEERAIATLDRTAYVVPETTVILHRKKRLIGKFQVGSVAAKPFKLELGVGDRFRLQADPIAQEVKAGLLPVMGCSMREPLLALTLDARVLFDDGKLECVVEGQEPGGVFLRVKSAPPGFRLGAEKGINLPDTPLTGPTLGSDDERALAFAVTAADMVGASFVRNPEDVRTLFARLAELGAEQLGVILKIETVAAFDQLPAILLAAMKRHPVGVMIARGDLAVEAGFERLAELQEEILWLCEAAHLPVIWATQVLDQLARTGTATRAEVSDAAMSVRAECVMLNKGSFVTEAVTALIDILERMEDHQYKKRSLYRRLHLELPGFILGSGPRSNLRVASE